MTKSQKQILHSEKCQIEMVKVNLGRGEELRYLINFSLLPGEMIALSNMISEPEGDVQQDVCAYFQNALEQMTTKR